MSLDVYPYSELKDYMMAKSYHRDLIRNCLSRCNESIKARGLEDYYTRQDTSISPVAVTGNGVYIQDSLSDYAICRNLYPNQIASSPETVRYVINRSESYIYRFTYDNGTKGYATNNRVVIKDVATGKIFFSKTYTSEPATYITGYGVYNDTYASPTEDTDEILSELGNIIPLH